MSPSDSSFSAKLKAGWSKADMMRYYCLTDNEYEKVHECVQRIQSETVRS